MFVGCSKYGSTEVRAQSPPLWSTSWQCGQNVAGVEEGADRTVAAISDGFNLFHGIDGSAVACCRNALSYSSQPCPPCRWARVRIIRP